MVVITSTVPTSSGTGSERPQRLLTGVQQWHPGDAHRAHATGADTRIPGMAWTGDSYSRRSHQACESVLYFGGGPATCSRNRKEAKDCGFLPLRRSGLSDLRIVGWMLGGKWQNLDEQSVVRVSREWGNSNEGNKTGGTEICKGAGSCPFWE